MKIKYGAFGRATRELSVDIRRTGFIRNDAMKNIPIPDQGAELDSFDAGDLGFREWIDAEPDLTLLSP